MVSNIPTPLLSFILTINNEVQTSEKKNQNSVYRVKLSPHAKIQLLLNTFKNGWKIKGSFLLWAFQLLPPLVKILFTLQHYHCSKNQEMQL